MRKSVNKKTAIPGHRPAEVAVGSSAETCCEDTATPSRRFCPPWTLEPTALGSDCRLGAFYESHCHRVGKALRMPGPEASFLPAAGRGSAGSGKSLADWVRAIGGFLRTRLVGTDFLVCARRTGNGAGVAATG